MEEDQIVKLCEFDEILEKEAANLSINILIKIINNATKIKTKFLAAKNIRNFAGIEETLKELFGNSVMSEDFEKCILENPDLLQFTKVCFGLLVF